jgi:hypothetical protein
VLILFVRYLPVWLLAAAPVLLWITGRPLLRRGALASRRASYRSLRIASPALNGLILTSVVGKPFLEHLQKNGWNSDLLAPELLLPLMLFFIVSLYAMIGAIIFFFFRALRNINAFSGEKQRSPYSSFFMLIPITNLIVIPYLEYFTYQRSLALANVQNASKLRAGLLVGSAFALLVASVACGLPAEDASQPASSAYDALSFLVLSVSTGGASGILTTWVIAGIYRAQERHAQQLNGPLSRPDLSTETTVHNPPANVLQYASLAALLIVALVTAVFPSIPSEILEAVSQRSLSGL